MQSTQAQSLSCLDLNITVFAEGDDREISCNVASLVVQLDLEGLDLTSGHVEFVVHCLSTLRVLSLLVLTIRPIPCSICIEKIPVFLWVALIRMLWQGIGGDDDFLGNVGCEIECILDTGGSTPHSVSTCLFTNGLSLIV